MCYFPLFVLLQSAVQSACDLLPFIVCVANCSDLIAAVGWWTFSFEVMAIWPLMGSAGSLALDDFAVAPHLFGLVPYLCLLMYESTRWLHIPARSLKIAIARKCQQWSLHCVYTNYTTRMFWTQFTFTHALSCLMSSIPHSLHVFDSMNSWRFVCNLITIALVDQPGRYSIRALMPIHSSQHPSCPAVQPAVWALVVVCSHKSDPE